MIVAAHIIVAVIVVVALVRSGVVSGFLMCLAGGIILMGICAAGMFAWMGLGR